MLNDKQTRSLFLSRQPDRYTTENTDSRSKILLPDETIIETVDEKTYRSIEEENYQESPVQDNFDAPTKGILPPWNLRTENNFLFHIAGFDPGIRPKPLLMDLPWLSNSGMVVEDHESTEGVFLGFLETHNDGTTTISCSKTHNDGTTTISCSNEQYGLPDKSTLNQRLQFVSYKSERSFEWTTNSTHYPEKNGIPERTNPEICELFFPILEYNKKPRTIHKSAQQESNKQIPKREGLSEESKKFSIFRNHRPELLNYWKIQSIIHTPLPLSHKENDPFEENFIRPLPKSTKEEYEIKSIIPKGKDLPISTKEKDVFPTLERRYRSQLNIHQQNTGFTACITI
jgi:hypothetical protein